jgi:hypothetical protein
MRGRHVIVTLALGLSAFAGGPVGCDAEPPHAAHALHPIPEERARELIAKTFREAGVPSEPNRSVEVGREGKTVRMEVAAAGRTFGVAYLTDEDWKQLGDSLPPRTTNGSLLVASGAEGMKILCLFASDYAEDDATGDGHAASTVAADRRLARDVKDFLHHAQEQEWK